VSPVHLRRETQDLAAVIGHAVESVAGLMQEGKHELTCSQPPGPMMVEGDTTRLEQVYVNLLTNAAKYTPKGGRISLTATAEGGDFIVRVRDTGEGIAADMLPRLFEMFTQVETSTHRSRGGLGVGLSLVKDSVELHGGSGTASSEGVGKGSEFVVRLPAASRTGAQSDGKGEAAASPVRSLRVLVVDDNADMANGMARLLKHLGHEVRVAHNGMGQTPSPQPASIGLRQCSSTSACPAWTVTSWLQPSGGRSRARTRS
jgi:hypothetical protein